MHDLVSTGVLVRILCTKHPFGGLTTKSIDDYIQCVIFYRQSVVLETRIC